MSRLDKRHRVVHEEKSLRLFAFNNFVNGYRPQHGLEEPAIVLRTKIKKADEHPALQWQQLAQLIFERKPLTHSSFVMDATRLDANTEQDELTHRGVEGPLLKRMANMLIKLAPKNAVLIGAGSTAEIVAKTAVCCPTLDGILGKIVLVCPQLAEVQRSLEASERRQQQNEKKKRDPTIEAVVILDAAGAANSSQWVTLLKNSFKVSILVIPTGGSLFGSIATAVVPVQREEQPTEGSRLANALRCYVITFRLSPYTKQAEQDVDLSPVTENPNLPPPDDNDEEEDADEADAEEGVVEEEAPIPSTESRYILSDLFNVKNARIRFEGNVVDGKTLANVHGKIELDELLPQLRGVAAGTTISLSAQLMRDEDGRTTLSSSTVANLTTGGPSTYYACGSSIPTFNYSAIRQYYGAALIRGRKIVLCRSLEGVWRGMRFPHRPHCEPFYTPMEAAMAAISDQCDVSGDNFYFHPAVAPVTYYPAAEKGSCVTLFVAFATFPSEGGAADDSKELLEQLHDNYDWYSYRTASAKLPTKAEREALADIKRNVQRAAEAGLYTPMTGHGVFGEDLTAANATSFPDVQVETATVSASDIPFGIQLSELIVVQDVFDSLSASEVAAHTGIEPARVKQWSTDKADSDWKGIAGGRGCIVLSSDHDIDTFAQQELPPTLPEDCPPQIKVVIVADPKSLEEHFVGAKKGRGRFVAALEYADALASRTKTSFSPVILHVLKATRPELPCISSNELAAFAAGGTLKDTEDIPPCPEFLSVSFTAKLPFHPERLHALVSDGALITQRWGCSAVLWINGTGWLSTSPLHSIGLVVEEGHITVSKSTPWWCCVEEGDRPEGLDTSDWDPTHGSRRQSLIVLVLADPVKHEAVKAAILADLRSALCAATDYRHWHRLADPFKLE